MLENGVFKAKSVKRFKVVIDDKSYEMTFPKVKHQRELVRQLAGCKDGSSEQLDLMISWLSTLGLPEDATNELAAEDLNELVQALVGESKKS